MGISEGTEVEMVKMVTNGVGRTRHLGQMLSAPSANKPWREMAAGEDEAPGIALQEGGQ